MNSLSSHPRLAGVLSSSRRRTLLVVLVTGMMGVPTSDTRPAELMAKNGMILQGDLGYLSSVAENPLAPDVPAGGVDVKQIVLLDDGLRRTYLSWHQIQDGTLRESDTAGDERDPTDHDVGPDHAAGETRQDAGQQGVLQELVLGDGVKELHARPHRWEWSWRIIRTSPP